VSEQIAEYTESYMSMGAYSARPGRYLQDAAGRTLPGNVLTESSLPPTRVGSRYRQTHRARAEEAVGAMARVEATQVLLENERAEKPLLSTQ